MAFNKLPLAETQTRWFVPFFTIWIGQQLSQIGSNIAQFTLVWWVTDATGSATVLASATFIALLPGVVLGPMAGVLVDRWNRRIVMIVADGFVALVACWVVYLFWTDTMQVWHIYVVMMARSIGGAFHWPAMTASTSLMVPENQLPRIAGLNEAMQGGVRIVAPPVAAYLLLFLPLHTIMGIDVGTAALAIFPLFFIIR